MMTGINEIGVARFCLSCGLYMEQSYAVHCRGKAQKGNCERCGKPSVTQIYQYTLRGHEYDRRGIKMIF